MDETYRKITSWFTDSFIYHEVYKSLKNKVTQSDFYQHWVKVRGKTELFWLCAGFVLFIFDLLTDIGVAVEYRRQGNNVWFGLTLCFILIPLVVVNIMAFAQIESMLHENENFLRYLNRSLIFSLSNMFLRFALQLIRWKQAYWDKHNEECTCANCEEKLSDFNKSTGAFERINYVETITEAAPQWCLQVYIMYRQWNFPWLTMFSTAVSLFSLAWSITNLEKVRMINEGLDFTVRSRVLFFVHQLVSLLSRLFAIVICAYVFSWYVFLVLGLHWLIMMIVIMWQGNERLNNLYIYDNLFCKQAFTCVTCFFLAFSFLFHPSKAVLTWLNIYSLSRYYQLYGVMFVENFLITLIAVFAVRPDIAHLSVVGPISLFFVTGGLILGPVFSVIYYYAYQKQRENE